MPGNPKSWDAYVDSERDRRIKKLDDQLSNTKSTDKTTNKSVNKKSSSDSNPSVSSAVKTIKKYKTDRHKLMDEIFSGDY